MPSERVQRRIDRLLDQADEAAETLDWSRVDEIARSVLNIDPANADASAFLGLAEPHLDAASSSLAGDQGSAPAPAVDGHIPEEAPASFASGRYQVSKFLGEGGKKRVYQAHDTLLDREVAFALIKTEGFDQTSKERISREAQAMGRLGVHPNIVAVLDLGQDADGSPYMVTELMGGGDVEALLAVADHGGHARGPAPTDGPMRDDVAGAVPRDRPEGGLPLERTIEIGMAVCEGLEFAHARGVVHRDLKPGNVWLTEDGSAKIGDFGLAVMTDRSRLTREGMMAGTVSYMPPEQATGGEITPRADLYSLGAMLYEMVTGRPPFLGDDEIAIIGQHINTPPVAPTWHKGDCPRPLEALLLRLLSKDPAERPDSAQDVFNALDAIDLTARGHFVEQDQTSLESLAGGVFVGRQAEMDQLKAALEDVLGGRGRLVTLVGEPGIGKTRTSEELATYAGLRGAQVLWGRCYETGGQPPYWPWVQAIRTYVREIDSNELRRQMGSSASVMAEIVTDVKDRLPDLQPPPQMSDPESARFRLFDSVASFLKTASQARPIVIVLDDLHWSDQPSLAFLEFMARELNQSRVLLVCTYRDMELNRRHPLTVTLGDLARERLYERVLLRGLSEQDVGRFIEIAAGINPPAELSATVHRHTEGNPLFVTEVVRELVQSGDLTEARTRGGSTWSLRIPEGVREVIGRRLDRLSERANETLTVAAVVGRQFTLGALRSIVEDTTESQFLDVLDEALAARVIEELPSSPGDYQFTHALFQETFTGELSAARRVRLHARIAEALEESYGEAADDHADELAIHFSEAEPVLGGDRLVYYSGVAGRRALDAFAYEAAVAHLSVVASALGGSQMSADTAEILSLLGLAQVAVNDESAASDSLTKAFDYYADSGDVQKAIELAAHPHNVNLLWQLAPVVRRALTLVGAESPDRGRLLVPFAFIAFGEGDHETAFGSVAEAIGMARQRGDEVLEMRALAMQSNMAGFARRNEESIDSASRALEMVSRHPEPETEMRARLWLSNGLAASGRAEEAIVAADEFLGAALKLGHSVWVGRSLQPIATVRLMRGDWEAALEAARAAARFAPNAAGALTLAVGLWTGDSEITRAGWEMTESLDVDGYSQITLFSALEVIDESDEIAVAARKIVVVRPPAGTLRRNDVSIQRNLLRRGLLAKNVDVVRENYELLVPDGIDEGSATAEVIALSFGSAARLIGDDEAALVHFQDAIRVSRQGGYRVALARALAGTSGILRDRGDIDAAEIQENEALAITRELGMRPLTENILARREILRA